MEIAYSHNDEDYNFRDREDVLQWLYDDDQLVEGRIYYEMDTESVDLAHYMRADRILDAASEALYDEVGEVAEDAFIVADAARNELDAFLREWVSKHVSGHYWRCVGKAREHKVTAEDVARFAHG